MPDQTWYTDNSRRQTGFECPRKRYLTYHAITGYGIQPMKPSMALEVGIAVHEGLAGVLRWCRDHDAAEALERWKIGPDNPLLAQPGTVGMPPKEVCRAAIQSAIDAFIKTISAGGGFTSAEQGFDPSFTQEEQCALIEALCWGWIRGQLPSFIAEHQVIMVEEEAPIEVKPGIVLQTKSDIVTRERSSKQLCVHDFKSTSSRVDDESSDFVGGFLDDLQLAGNIAGIEAKLGERVEGFYIHALLKGGRGRFKKKGQEPTATRQYSDLVYAKLSPPRPPVQREWRVDTSGYWWDKQPVWQMSFGQPAEVSAVEHYILNLLPLPTLQACFARLGPYLRPSDMIARLPRQVAAHEEDWLQRLWRLHDSGLPWSDLRFQELLDEVIPPSWQCKSYGEMCAFYDICRLRGNWRDPLGNGFKLRKAHHEQEAEQMKERGL